MNNSQESNSGKRLGRGLAALLGDISINDFTYNDSPAIKTAQSLEDTISCINLPISELHTNPNQPRKFFDDENIAELATSIRINGIIQPLVVEKIASKRYQIVAGERRYRAAVTIGLEKLPCIIRNETPERESLMISLVENLQRSDLNPIEEAECYQYLCQKFAYTHDEISGKIGKSRSYVTNAIRLTALPIEVKVMLLEKQLSVGHAKVLLTLNDPMKIFEFAKYAAENEISVRELQQLISAGDGIPAANQADESDTALDVKPNPTWVNEIPQQIFMMEDKFNSKFSSQMAIKPSKSDPAKGAMMIKYSSLEELYEVMNTLVDVTEILIG